MNQVIDVTRIQVAHWLLAANFPLTPGLSLCAVGNVQHPTPGLTSSHPEESACTLGLEPGLMVLPKSQGILVLLSSGVSTLRSCVTVDGLFVGGWVF